MTGSITPVTPVVDLYGLASRLLTLVVDGFSGRGVTLPTVQYVFGGTLLAYDGPQVTVNVNQVTDGRPGGGVAASIDPYSMIQYVDLTVAIVRPYPADVPRNAPQFKQVADATKTNLIDVGTLRAVLVDIRSQQLLVDDSMPFAMPLVRTEGPEGGVVAAVGLVSVSAMAAVIG